MTFYYYKIICIHYSYFLNNDLLLIVVIVLPHVSSPHLLDGWLVGWRARQTDDRFN